MLSTKAKSWAAMRVRLRPTIRRRSLSAVQGPRPSTPLPLSSSILECLEVELLYFKLGQLG